ncbi:Bug family tripartite tricarboxylate transporter substrate binding protein [Alcaligenes endophyticus]|uniref:Tripartite tricarboxylate transporter substrate binding protein n=1 Tax=Alcaligenes endophyticus TaxID=1929088 RepID=A0ABT8EFK8_9BURK|nr:tripartite tricarboxylate transporter substrate binding protein [Alcaligenes endophyticus]MCX5590376.1 tripartite tricarboxylate transporter substrate binding protein [Alcaligenes endophyticus]MDN4119960.1 tripartite tricarboxylate transporter substrate binding protein [Alcaligenes endophyticus]
MKLTALTLTRRQALTGLLALSALTISALSPVHAESDYPKRSVRLIVPYAPGGATDVIGRVLGKELGEALGQTFVVENRAGAGGSLGAGQVAKSNPDGYTLLMGAFTSHTINAALTPELVNFEIDKSFDYVSVVGTVPLVFAVNKKVPVQNVMELVELSKQNPGDVSFASAGTGSPQHLAIEMFKQQAGADVIHVPYRGSGPALADLLGGQVNVMIDTVPAALGMIKSGDIRALATTTKERVPSLPDVPTVVEAGMPDMQISSMFAIAAPAGTPKEITDKLNGALEKILSNPEVQASMLAQGTLSTHATPEESAKMINEEFAKWQKLIKDNDIKVE